jgi:hypothetical protein
MPSPYSGDTRQICRHSKRCSELSKDVRRRLRKEHLTHVYSDVVRRTSNLDERDLETLGFAPNILSCFGRPTDPNSFQYKPTVSGFQLLPESAKHSVRHLRLQMPDSGESVAIGLKLLRDLLLALDPAITFTVIVKPGVNRNRMASLIRSWGAEPTRVSLVEHACETLFAQDNGKTGILPDGTTALMLPRAANRSRNGDTLSPEKLSDLLGLPILSSKLYWEGGNVLYDGHTCLIGAQTIANNVTRFGLSEQQVKEAFKLEFGAKVLVMGDMKSALESARAHDENGNADSSETGQADFHIDLDLCVLGQVAAGSRRPVVAIADPLLGAKYRSSILRRQELFEHHFLPAKDMQYYFRQILQATIERRVPLLEGYAKTLKAAGYALIGVPDIRLAPELNYLARVNMSFNYCNVLPAGHHSGRPVVYLFHYGIPTLDKAADKVYRSCGLKPLPISSDVTTAHELLMLRGGLHCLCAKMG